MARSYRANGPRDRSAAAPFGRSHRPANKLCKRQASRYRSRIPSRCLPHPLAPYSDHRCTAFAVGCHRCMPGEFGRDRRRFPMRTAATLAKMSSTHHRLDILRRLAQWQNGHLILRLTADSFPRLLSISYSTVCPSFSELRPARSTAEMWTNTSLPPPPEG